MQNTIQQPSQKVHKSWQKLSLQELKIHINENKKTQEPKNLKTHPPQELKNLQT